MSAQMAFIIASNPIKTGFHTDRHTIGSELHLTHTQAFGLEETEAVCNTEKEAKESDIITGPHVVYGFYL